MLLKSNFEQKARRKHQVIFQTPPPQSAPLSQNLSYSIVHACFTGFTPLLECALAQFLAQHLEHKCQRLLKKISSWKG